VAGFGCGACEILIAAIVESIDGFSYVSSAILTPPFLVAGTVGWSWPADLGHLGV
jgi:lipooligosaccharide transport system permease protein